MTSRGKLFAPLGVIVLVLALAATACNLPNVGPQAPCAVTRSPDAASRVVERIRGSAEQGGTISVTANNDEVSSLLEQSIEEGKRSNPQNTVDISNPIVCFTPGKMQIFGSVRPSAEVAVDALITLGARVENGRMAVNVQRVQVGPVGLPDQVRQDVETQVNDMLNQYLQYVTLTDVEFQQGQMTLTGTIGQ